MTKRRWADSRTWRRQGLTAVEIVLLAVATCGGDGLQGTGGPAANLSVVQGIRGVWLDAQNRIRPAMSDGTVVLAISKAVPDDPGLPRGAALVSSATDPDAVRIEIQGSDDVGPVLKVDVCSRPAAPPSTLIEAAQCRGFIGALPCGRIDAGRYRCPFLRLVSDETDASPMALRGQLLLASLGDDLAVRVHGPAEAPVFARTRVGRLDEQRQGQAPLSVRMRLTVVRTKAGGPPSIAARDDRAVFLARRQVAIANERWAQCGISLGTPQDLPVTLVDPPGPVLLSVANESGALAAGGRILFMADGRPVGPVVIPPDSEPLSTAQRVADALRKLGFTASVSRDPPVSGSERGSADVLVRRSDGHFAQLAAVSGEPLTTDSRQSATIGAVDLSDGLHKFQAYNSHAGTLEERTLLKALVDDDPATVDIVFINRFDRPGNLAETFIEQDNGPIPNIIVLTSAAVDSDRSSFAMAHELGHILLDLPGHPDRESGIDTASRLMDSDASGRTIRGPKRLLVAECLRAIEVSGPAATPVLLAPVSYAALPPEPVTSRIQYVYPDNFQWSGPAAADPKPKSPGRLRSE